MIVGYARVSTQEQSLNAQIEELKAAGCERVFAEKESGAKSNRPALANGVQFGRKKKLTHFQRQEALARLEAGGDSVRHCQDVRRGQGHDRPTGLGVVFRPLPDASGSLSRSSTCARGCSRKGRGVPAEPPRPRGRELVRVAAAVSGDR